MASATGRGGVGESSTSAAAAGTELTASRRPSVVTILRVMPTLQSQHRAVGLPTVNGCAHDVSVAGDPRNAVRTCAGAGKRASGIDPKGRGGPGRSGKSGGSGRSRGGGAGVVWEVREVKEVVRKVKWGGWITC